MPALALAAFVLGIWLLQQQAQLPSNALLSALLLSALAMAGFAFGLPQRLRVLCALCAVLACTGLGFAYAALIAQHRLADQLAARDEGRDLRIQGVISSLPAQLQHGLRFEFDVDASLTADAHVPERLALSWYGGGIDTQRIRPGQRWEFTVRLKQPHGALNPGGFDLEAWMIERGLRATGYVRDGARDASPRLLDELSASPNAWLQRARHHLRERLQTRLQALGPEGARYGGVLVALVLGDQRAITEDDWEVFNRSGISHLVSISGLHITMIAGLAAWLVNAAWRRSRRGLAAMPAQQAAAIAACLAALAYCLLAGWGVPAQRTFFMLLTVALAFVLRARLRVTTVLAAAAFVVCLLDPWAVLSAGFWLSFAAVAAILFATPGQSRIAEPGWRDRLRTAVHVQLAVTIALVPLSALLFQQVSLVSPLANAVAIPLVSWVITPLALLAAAFVALPEPLAAFAVPLLSLAHWLFEWLARGLELLLLWDWASLALPAPPWWLVLLALIGVAWLLTPRGWPWRSAGALCLLPLFVWPAARPAADELWVTAIDVGQGMAVLVETQDRVLLYDTGPRYSAQANAGARVIAPYLRWRGIGRLDLLVVSHLDSDHSGGTASLLKALQIDEVWTSIAREHAMLQAASKVQPCMQGQGAHWGALRLRVLHPLASDYGAPAMSTNAMSCVLELHWMQQRVLLTGDIPAREERALLQREPALRTTLLTAPHHGSRHSSTEAFVRATAPDWVIVQAGYRNRFGHPDPTVLARYQAQGAQVARTDQGGALQWQLSPRGVLLRQWRRQHARYWHRTPEESVGRDAQQDEPADDASAGSPEQREAAPMELQ